MEAWNYWYGRCIGREILVMYCQTASVSAAHAFRDVIHTVPRVGRIGTVFVLTMCRDTLRMRRRTPLGPYSRHIPSPTVVL